jgi:hypothetical protein
MAMTGVITLDDSAKQSNIVDDSEKMAMTIISKANRFCSLFYCDLLCIYM